MDIIFFRKNRISLVVTLVLVAGILLFVFSLFSAVRRSDQVEESQLRLIVENLQLENRIVFSGIESAVRLEGKLIESGEHDIVNGKLDISELKRLIDVTDKVAAIGIISETGEEYAIQKRNNLYATYYYQSASDTFPDVHIWDGNQNRVKKDSLVGNRMFTSDIFRIHEYRTSDKQLWSQAANLPGYSGRKGLSASILVTDKITNKRYIVIFFVPFKRIMTNVLKVGYEKGDVFIFRNDSLYFNFDGSVDSAPGFDTIQYFVNWKDIPIQKHAEALKTWQSLDTISADDSIRIIRFRHEDANYYAAISPVLEGHRGTYYALVVPSSTLPTLFRSQSGVLLLVAFALLLVSGIVYAVHYVRNHKRLRYVPLTVDGAKQLIAQGENDLVEFKSTIRTNLHTGKPGKEIELAWLKSVVAFCNTEGGTILIGVHDHGNILGLDADLFQNDDKCLLHVQNLIGEHVGVEYLSYVRFSLLSIDDKKILTVQCIPLKRIMLLKNSGKEQFYVRSGPSSIELPMSKVLEYVNDRNKKF